MKRWRPRARGTATRILKPTSHIYVEVSSGTESKINKEKKSEQQSQKAAKAAATEAAKTKTKAKAKAEKPAAPAKAEKKGDDLTKIKGIGKAYQKKLHDEGIFTYDDVAGMSEEQIAMMEEKYSFKGDFRESVADAANFVDGKDA
jgi:predicted flap endonuclease-1-like 5' DNA nuclease